MTPPPPLNVPPDADNEKRASAASSGADSSMPPTSTTVLAVQRSSNANSDNTTIRPSGPPQLDFSFHKRKLIGYIFFVMFCNLAVPCLIYYLVDMYGHRISFQTNIGISSASLGLSSCFDAPYRLYHLTKHRKLYGPLKDDVWWHGDFFMWTYTFALFSFAFPLAIAPALTPVAIDFFLMSTAMLIQPFGVVLAFTLTRLRLPVWCSSDPPGTPMKPGAFYVLEDLGAVDFREGRLWRKTCYDRYAASPPFRSLMLILTWYWIIMTTVYTGLTAAVTWASPTNFAFAFVLGQLFIWLGLASLGSWGIVHWGLRRERRWWDSAPQHVFDELGAAAGPVEPKALEVPSTPPVDTSSNQGRLSDATERTESGTHPAEMRQTNSTGSP